MSRLLATRTSRRVVRLGHLRPCLSGCAAVAAAAGLLGLLVGGGQAAGAAVGVVVAAAVFALGAVTVDAADRVATSLVLPVGLAAYGTTVVVLGTVVVRFEGSAGPVVAGLPWGVLAGVLTWVPLQAWWAWTSPTPYVDMPDTGSV